ncbi:GlxA family transcriptional regulator [Sphaerisporangium krabiense]|uniref:Transcriptional regulator GlxA family with amidase domain n=1 Tax=Sphaerisporangium krabiense TaxID=763782 RepID=A0A7W8ZCB4_9ACTN|nr:helix-turn-helix domain-containing protein [Sphaerisporangium krabiense]MBB5631407.1 transcriptional regulator GlxA family with amidase domain [Sphaerisporangium krabiense]
MTPFRSVVAYAGQEVSAFGLGVISKVFADRTHLGLPSFSFQVCTDEPGPVYTDLGLRLEVPHGLELMAGADLVVLLPNERRPPALSPEVVAAVRAAHRAGAILASFCTGSYLLAATGLLDGRRATTHWSLAADLAARYPRVTVVPEALYVDEGRLVTGAGDAAGIDMSLHLLRREHGGAVANAIARETVTAPHRDGGQAQYIPAPVPAAGEDERLAEVLEWVRANLSKPLSVSDLAAQALMSPRTFARRFKAATGTTPQAWIRGQRLLVAEELLETTDLRIEEIARDVGFGSVTVLREQIVKRRGVSPRAYRRTFSRR